MRLAYGFLCFFFRVSYTCDYLSLFFLRGVKNKTNNEEVEFIVGKKIHKPKARDERKKIRVLANCF